MKVALRAIIVLLIIGVPVVLVLTGTLNLKSAFTNTNQKFMEARQMLLEEDFGVGVYLGDDFEATVEYLGKPSAGTEYGLTTSASYYLPLDSRITDAASADGEMTLVAYNNAITGVTIRLFGADDNEPVDLEFAGALLEDLEPDDLTDRFGKPAARFVILGNKVFAWYLLPPVKTKEGYKLDLGGTMQVTARFSKAGGELRTLSVKVPHKGEVR